MKKIILTPNRVGELATWADAVTGIPRWIQGMGNPGDGYVYQHGRKMRSWRGARANHRCASYLLGVIQASARGRAELANTESWLAETYAAVQLNPREFNEGQADAEHAIREARRVGGSALRAVREAGA